MYAEVRGATPRGACATASHLVMTSQPGLVMAGAPFSIEVEVRAPDGDPYGPAGMSIDEQSGAIEWVPTAAQAASGDVAVVLVAENAAGSAVQEWRVAVAGGGEGPVDDDVPPGERVLEPAGRER